MRNTFEQIIVLFSLLGKKYLFILFFVFESIVSVNFRTPHKEERREGMFVARETTSLCLNGNYPKKESRVALRYFSKRLLHEWYLNNRKNFGRLSRIYRARTTLANVSVM